MKTKNLLPALALAAFAGASLPSPLQAWEPVGDKIKTRFSQDVDPSNTLPEYPRPQLVRQNWTNLNGLWSYAIVSSDAPAPETWDGEILVPFAVESSLSGVGRSLGPHQALWYKRTFEAPSRRQNERVLLHFGAVDWHTTVEVNGQVVGEHKGGYDPFTFDITPFLTRGGPQTLVLKVLDATGGIQPRGKQTLSPAGIFYTASSGIWQTVWLEKVPDRYIRRLAIIPDIDTSSVLITTDVGENPYGSVTIQVLDDRNRVVAFHFGPAGTQRRIQIPSPRLWSPSDPYLYRLRIRYGADTVDSYLGMRKISVAQDENGINRLFLNNQPLFQYGPLDQGFWPDGLYTAPTDEGLRYDLEVTKAQGFNIIRKHVKVEPARWYYWADRLGLLIWQDFPSVMDQKLPPGAADIIRTPAQKAQIETEMKPWSTACGTRHRS